MEQQTSTKSRIQSYSRSSFKKKAQHKSSRKMKNLLGLYHRRFPSTIITISSIVLNRKANLLLKKKRGKYGTSRKTSKKTIRS
jgi:hypothetical protein